MKLTFKTYIDQELQKQYLNEANQPSLKQLIDNFGKVFPYSEKDLPVINTKINGWDTANMKIQGKVKSEEGDPPYDVVAEFHRNSPDMLWSIEMVGKVNCTCPAFRYNTAYPDAKNGVLSGTLGGAEKIANKIRNPKKIPSVCKHLYSFLHLFYENKLKTQKPIKTKPEEKEDDNINNQTSTEQNVNTNQTNTINRGENENREENTQE